MGMLLTFDGARPSTSHSHRAITARALRLGTLGDERRHHARGEHLPVAADHVVAHQPHAIAPPRRQIARKDVTRRIEVTAPAIDGFSRNISSSTRPLQASSSSRSAA